MEEVATGFVAVVFEADAVVVEEEVFLLESSLASSASSHASSSSRRFTEDLVIDCFGIRIERVS